MLQNIKVLVAVKVLPQSQDHTAAKLLSLTPRQGEAMQKSAESNCSSERKQQKWLGCAVRSRTERQTNSVSLGGKQVNFPAICAILPLRYRFFPILAFSQAAEEEK